jgi:hypothetical protein
MNDDLLADNPVEPKNFLAELVGTDKKFKDAEALAKGKYEADRFIEIKNKQYDDLVSEYGRVLEDNKQRAKLEEVIKDLETKLASSDSPTAKEVPQPTVKPEDIESLVERKFTEKETARQQQTNQDTVRKELTKLFGDNYAPQVRKRIEELGLTPEQFNQWARQAPNAAVAAVGANQQPREGFETPPRTSRTFKPVTETKHTWSYYQELKKSNPKAYYDKSIMNQMLADAEALGAEFEDGDFHTRDR